MGYKQAENFSSTSRGFVCFFSIIGFNEKTGEFYYRDLLTRTADCANR